MISLSDPGVALALQNAYTKLITSGPTGCNCRPDGFTGPCEAQAGPNGEPGADKNIHSTQQNINAILYILNQTIGKYIIYSASDIQAAIWTILFSPDQVNYLDLLPAGNCPTFGYCRNNTKAIITDTFASIIGLTPSEIILETNNIAGAILIEPPCACSTVDCTPLCPQIMIMQYKLNCCDCEDYCGGSSVVITKQGPTGPTGPTGPIGPTGPRSTCLCCIEKVDCFNESFGSDVTTGQIEEVTFNISYTSGGTDGIKTPNILSFVNINVTNSTPVNIPATTYNGWCASTLNEINIDQIYTYDAYSILDSRILSTDPTVNPLLIFFTTCEPTAIVYTNNMCAILYIINSASYYEKSLLYTSSDIQTAIWTLIFNNGTYPYAGPLTSDPSAPNYTPSHVYDIINSSLLTVANISDCRYIPCLFDVPQMVLVIIPKNNLSVRIPVVPICPQPLFLQIQLDKIKLCCCPPVCFTPGQVIRQFKDTQPIPTGIDTPVLFNTIIGQDTIPIDVKNGIFTIPFNGVYAINAMLAYWPKNHTGTRRYLKIKVGNEIYMQTSMMVDTNPIDLSISFTNYFIKGTEITIVTYHDATTDAGITGGHMSITRITQF